MTVIERLAKVAGGPDATKTIQGVRHADINGIPWAVATDGHVCVAVRHADAAALPIAEAPTAAYLLEWLERPPVGEVVTNMAAIRAWAAKGGPEHVPCEECAGNPSSKQEECDRCSGDGEHECECGDVHTCPECDGTGHTEGCGACDDGQVATTPVLGQIAGWTGDACQVNLNIVVSGLAAIPDTADDVQVVVKWGKPFTPVHFHPAHGDWFMVVSPIRNTDKPRDVAILG